MISKKKKVLTKFETDFLAKIGNLNAFLSRITTPTLQLRHPISFAGGLFHFFTKNRSQKHQIRAILHTLQANGGGLEPKNDFPNPKIGDLQKKKVFTEFETDFLAKIGNLNAFLSRITTPTSQLRHPISFAGGAVSFFHQKSVSKAPNTCDFAYFTGQWRGARAPPGYATARFTENPCVSFLPLNLGVESHLPESCSLWDLGVEFHLPESCSLWDPSRPLKITDSHFIFPSPVQHLNVD